MDKTVQSLLDFFYANKRLYDAMHGKPDTRKFDNFVNEYCKHCGNHCCNPNDAAWRSECHNWHVYSDIVN